MDQYHILITIKCMTYRADIPASVKHWYLEEKNSFTLNQQLLDNLGLEKWKTDLHLNLYFGEFTSEVNSGLLHL